jgi:uncharacterized damage-inducible protein DinB
MEDRYPIGTYEEACELLNQEGKSIWLQELRQLPEELSKYLQGVSETQLLTPISEGAWNGSQLVHHIADANMNSFIHFKLAMTEDNPVIKPYYEDRWSVMADEMPGSLPHSILLLRSIIGRWIAVLESMTEEEYQRTFTHPVNGVKRLSEYLGFCMWHNRHHMAQLKKQLR